MSERSLTVHHNVQPQAVIGCVGRALAEPDLPALPRVDALPVSRTAVLVQGESRRRCASRRLLVCAVAGLAIALLPDPLAPAMIALRLLACAITSAVQHHEEAFVEPCRLTRLLNTVAELVGLHRAENLIRALLKRCLLGALKSLAPSTSVRAAMA